jgi:hypothetical protein
MSEMQNKGIIRTSSNSSPKIQATFGDTKQVLSASNNRAQYYSDLAKKYMEETIKYKDSAKYYAEQNSNVTVEYIEGIQNSLETKISTKQPLGDYAYSEDLPKSISDLDNDLGYITKSEVLEVLPEDEIPSQENNAGKFLTTDGEKVSWGEISSYSLFDRVVKDYTLSYEESKGFALQGTYVYKEALAGSRYGYPDFYAKCVEEKEAGTATQITFGGETILMYVHSNGHKFYDIADKETVDKWYKIYGVADFYGVDAENERVFLPRGLHGELVESYTDGISGYRIYSDGYCEQWGRIPKSTPSVSFLKTFANTDYNVFFAFYDTTSTGNVISYVISGVLSTTGFTTYSSSSTRVWQASGYLAKGEYSVPANLTYYVVGNTTNYEGMSDVVSQGMTILEQVNQGLSSKADVDLSNSSVVHIIDTYINGTSGYRIYSDGYCEQWGYTPITGNTIVTLSKIFADTNYCITTGDHYTNNTDIYAADVGVTKTTSSFSLYHSTTSGYTTYWKATGYLAKGQY